jgi:2-polyprenyl-3-methyl-5-hydroxy-6-metoxy-1,4-benzoquinol methylase
MDSATQKKLYDITQDFYTKIADDFSQTRQAPWKGWTQLLTELRFPEEKQKDLRVLDVGCGNGRFALFLKNNSISFKYTGVDSNENLLSHAKVSLDEQGIPAQLIHQDIFFSAFSSQFTVEHECAFNIVSCFGVLHHLPGSENRQRFIQDLTNLVETGGYLLISLWQFAKLERYQQKTIDPSTVGIMPNELEAGDYLLGWDATNAVRYCHSFSEEEITELIESSGMKLVTRFYADGKEGNANTYLVLQKA